MLFIALLKRGRNPALPTLRNIICKCLEAIDEQNYPPINATEGNMYSSAEKAVTQTEQIVQLPLGNQSLINKEGSNYYFDFVVYF